MWSKRTAFLLFSVTVALTLLAAQCAVPVATVEVEKEVIVTMEVEKEVVVTATPEPVEEPKIIRVGQNAADLSSLDPHFATTTEARALVDMIFNGLVRYAPGDGSFENMEPDLAAELPTAEIVDDKQVWTIKLREGVMCHGPGNLEPYELTSEDVVYSLEKSATPERSAYAGEYDGWTVEALDDYTVQITLENPISPEFTQVAYRVGDSTTNIIAPMMSYFALIVAFMQRYDEKAGIGTVIATMLPYTVVFLVVWIALLVIWMLTGQPIGPGAPIHLAP